MNNSFDIRYSEVKSVFENIAAKVICATFNETPETSTMCLKVMHKGALLEYFYIKGNTQVYRYINEDNLTPLSSIPAQLERMILSDIEL